MAKSTTTLLGKTYLKSGTPASESNRFSLDSVGKTMKSESIREGRLVAAFNDSTTRLLFDP